MKYFLDNREVEIDKIEGEVGEGAFVVAAGFCDGDLRDLTDTECDRLSELYQDIIYEKFYQTQVMHAEYWADCQEDR